MQIFYLFANAKKQTVYLNDCFQLLNQLKIICTEYFLPYFPTFLISWYQSILFNSPVWILFGTTETTLDMIESYPSDRRQFVAMGGHKSKIGSVKFGFPLGINSK